MSHSLETLIDEKVEYEWGLQDLEDDLENSLKRNLMKSNESLDLIKKYLNEKGKARFRSMMPDQEFGRQLNGMNEADLNAILYKCQLVN